MGETENMPELNNKSIIVTGAARGIGQAMAEALAAAGASVVVADLDGDTAESVAQGIRNAGGNAIASATDVTDRAAVRATIDRCVFEFGRLDAYFNNAGIAQTLPFLNISEADWRRMMDVNAMSVLIGTQEAVKQMIAQGGGGKIVNTASVAGKQCHDPLAHYGASKFAVVALTQAAARAFGGHGITANAICPGIVATKMWDKIDEGFREAGLSKEEGEALEAFSDLIVLKRPSVPSDITGLAVFLASSGSDYITGQSMLVDGGIVFV